MAQEIKLVILFFSVFCSILPNFHLEQVFSSWEGREVPVEVMAAEV